MIYRSYELPRSMIVGSEQQNDDFRSDMFRNKHKTCAVVDEASSNIKTSQINSVKMKKAVGENTVIKSKGNGCSVVTKSYLMVLLLSNKMAINDVDPAAASRLLMHVPRRTVKTEFVSDFFTRIPKNPLLSKLVETPEMGDYLATFILPFAQLALYGENSLEFESASASIQNDTRKMMMITRGDLRPCDMFKDLDSPTYSGAARDDLRNEEAVACVYPPGTKMSIPQFVTISSYLRKIVDFEETKQRLELKKYSAVENRDQMKKMRATRCFEDAGYLKHGTRQRVTFIEVTKNKKGILLC